MNKRFLFGMFATAGMLLATSCSSDELEKIGPGNEAQVTFALNVENGVQTKAISDGTSADKLVYAVYNTEGEALGVFENSDKQKVETNLTDLKTGHKVTINLAKGQTYQVAFWAQDADCKAYNTDDLKNVTVSYDKAANNDETRDAFFKTVELTVTGDASMDVELKRPFAQINVGVTEADWNAAVASGLEIANSSVVIKNAATSLNLLTGAVSGSTEVNYSLAAIPNETLLVDTDSKVEGKESYKWLSMSYLLVNDENDGASKVNLESLAFTFAPTKGNNIVFDNGLNNVPVQRNWRTNILGKLLTGDITFNITIDPIYDGDINIEDGDQSTNEIVPGVVLEGTTYKLLSIEGLKWFREVVNGTAKAPTTKAAETDYYKQDNFSGKTVVLANDIDLSNEKWTPIGNGCAVGGDGLKPTFSGTFDGGNHTISNMTVSVTGEGVENGAGLFANAVGTIKNVKLVNPTVSGNHYAGAVVGYIYGHIENCHVEGGKIVSNVIKKDNGDKAGGIVGYVGEGTSRIENCSVINTTVEAYRDVAALIGCAQNGTTVKGNTVDNVTVIANQLAEYGESKDANAGQLIGRKLGTVTEEGNSVNNVPVNELKKSISTAEDLAAIATFVNAGNNLKGITLTLANDIDLQNKPWTPIGESKKPFSGTFDGNNHTISNLNLDMAGQSNVGLFGHTTMGTIKNLTIENATVKGYLNVAVVAGKPYTSKYENITVKGLVKVDGFSYVGAVGGKDAYANWTNITVSVSEGSYVKANSVEGETAYRTYVGGVIGFRGEGNIKMENVSSNIDVTGSTCDVGGIAGIAHYGNSFINCSSSGKVTISAVSDADDAKEIGGIAGVWHPGGANVTFTNCEYTGELSVNLEGIDLTNFSIVGAAYNSTGAGKLIIDDEEHTAADWNK